MEINKKHILFIYYKKNNVKNIYLYLYKYFNNNINLLCISNIIIL